MECKIGNTMVGDSYSPYIIAEVGINHQGDVEIAKKLIRMASENGFDSVKFQKRDTSTWPDTPYYSNTFKINTSYRHHKELLEFNTDQYSVIIDECRKCNIAFSVSVWDIDSYTWLRDIYDAPYIKIPSACLTDLEMVDFISKDYCGIIIVSTGMSTIDEIDDVVDIVDRDRLILLHCTSTYPASNDELNLRCITAMRDRYNVLVGYSGHEVGLQASLYAATLGACVIERHITYDRTAPGTDHASSLEYDGQRKLVRDLKLLPTMLGDGIKCLYDSEIPVRSKLRYKEL